MPSLSIEMENDSVCIESGYSSSHVSGCLLLKNGSSDDNDAEGNTSLPCTLSDYISHIRMIGKEKIEQCDNDLIIMDDTFSLSTSIWKYHHTHQGYVLFFDLPLSGDIPISFTGDRGCIEYTLMATVQCCNMTLRSMHPLNLYRGFPTLPSVLSSSSSFSTTSSSSTSSSSSFFTSTTVSSPLSISSPSFSSHLSGISNRSRLCWGMSDQSQWQYELELPQVIDASQSFLFTLRTRMRCIPENHGTTSLRNESTSLESCMIGVQLYESVQIGSSTASHKILMTKSQVLSQPSMTWINPCIMSLDLIQTPTSSTFCGHRINVNHHLQITLNYCSSQGQSDRICFDCIVPLIASPPPLKQSCNHIVDTMIKMMIQKPVKEKKGPAWVNQEPDFTLDNQDNYLL